MIQFNSDYRLSFKDFSEGYSRFVYTGPGWYHRGTDTALVVADDDGEPYAVYVWNGADPRDAFRKILALPSR